ncbi:organic hydroperoxide resistance protein [Marinitenerispora sediminis]|uniref:Organic hydroperoxide resistance protein n=1 Tax=Marinitenerispora sediminis TaxID=1931232 RepID=A0A368T7U1_9ACTN|nr:organic hydroperoxide resistance protein [Marinitenerispora sediminis]RCV50300.1 organic hydroperoxide resistance protein [Marinitenerispora sediminis]RCV53765.1 organic hydroperoxide resistance protein [Marinitenerispora sediminis]RCV58054.1 organic hydroperoxide resistance protein [Marinitenerispora sediminis]
MSDPVYTAIATSTGDGRAGGRAATNDGLLDVTLAVPREMGGPGTATNPEQLFAAGWASCLHSALKAVAAGRKVAFTDSAVIAEISVHRTEQGGFALSTALHVEVAGIDQRTADELVHAAHAVCPYSNATRGNIPVTLETTVA